ncbi:para-aminobenzoate synthetase/4-amino-4-deoxychorismate lyase [Sphingomonas sp. BK036]|uniref:aminodeoxychorismate synthase component I n=1 Tax=Sphingomonas sp. BK036 TaxID=2512122 RepID=UPI001029BB72|nr:aminodeoxychorismate synthase component I [Sphingomonas sp. BK036]RZT45436.1 para-aminobenzoate synthetase/4-amino-4-deoxychorismate lyase [Sphingomonas sp. BK036]
MWTAPFVLLDDAREGGAPARLYRDPIRIVRADTLAEVRPALDALRAARADGLHPAGYLTYEAGAALASKPLDVRSEGPLLWFGLFAGYETFAAHDVAASLPDPAGAWTGAPRPLIDRDTYDASLKRVLDLIAAGDIYQANLTFAATVPFVGDPLALYARLRRQAGAGYGALIDTGETRVLSLSPELFFALDGDTLTCRPMKGTASRGETPDTDRMAAEALAADPKQRAENLMIVDLMRNDLSRVAARVAVPDLFTVETYPTVHQMTSTVTATLKPGCDAVDVLAALFPCGSITGAPKQRAMEVIAEVEHARTRGIYTGAIGRFDPSGDAIFNVAIRTIAIADGAATMSLGSGIVADSVADAEWAECHAKGAFVTAGQRPFDLIETMAFDPDDGLTRLEAHLARMKASAERLGFTFDRHTARNELQAATFRLRGPRRIRLLLSPSGAIAIEAAPLPHSPSEAHVAIVPLPVAPADFRLRHKTSARGFYDAARKAAGTFEVLFEDADGFLTEGSFTSLFVPRGEVLVTPPLRHGLLPGILRAELLESGRAIEAPLTRADLAGGFFIGNAVRGLIPAIVAVAKSVTRGV